MTEEYNLKLMTLSAEVISHFSIFCNKSEDEVVSTSKQNIKIYSVVGAEINLDHSHVNPCLSINDAKCDHTYI